MLNSSCWCQGASLDAWFHLSTDHGRNQSQPLRKTYLYDDQSDETLHLFQIPVKFKFVFFLSLALTTFQSAHIISEVILTWLIASG